MLGLDSEINKSSFISKLSVILKSQGYKKIKNYWYKENPTCIFCVFVQGSQWSNNDYYLNIGVKEGFDRKKYPTELYWTWWHRCHNRDGKELNISIESAVECIEVYFGEYVRLSNESFYLKHKSLKIGKRWIVL